MKGRAESSVEICSGTTVNRKDRAAPQDCFPQADAREGFHEARVVHLVPMDGLGGTEAAARSLDPAVHKEAEVWFMVGPSLSRSPLIRTLSPQSSLGTPTVYWRALRRLLVASPEVLVCSLWRSSMVGLAWKILRPRNRFVLMIHSNHYAHLMDRLVSRLAMKMADAIWCDSAASQAALVPSWEKAKSSVISFVLPPDAPRTQSRTNDFAFWGRLVKGKGVPRAISIFRRVHEQFPEVRFRIYGPPGGDSEAINAVLGNSAPGSVMLMGEKPPGSFPEPIPSAGFFILPSTHEGMAVAVVEAMQLGLIPVVTAVGEIANYCKNGENSIIIESDEQAVRDIGLLMSDPRRLAQVRQAAIDRWSCAATYSNDFFNAYMPHLAANGSRQQ